MKISVIFAALALACIASAKGNCDEDACEQHCISDLDWDGGFCDEDDCMCNKNNGRVQLDSLIEPLKSPVTEPKVDAPKEESKPPVTEPNEEPPKEEPKPPVTESKVEPPKEEPKPPVTEPKGEPPKEANPPVTEPKIEPPKEEPKTPVTEPKVDPPRENPKPTDTKPEIEPPKEEPKTPVIAPTEEPPKEEFEPPVIAPKVDPLKEEPQPTLTEPEIDSPKPTKPRVIRPKVKNPIKNSNAECDGNICLAHCEREDWMWGLCHEDMCWCYKKQSDSGMSTKSWNIRKLFDDILDEKDGAFPEDPEIVPRAEVEVTTPIDKEAGDPKPLPNYPPNPECDETDCLDGCEREDWLWSECYQNFCWCWEKKYYHGRRTVTWNVRKLLLDILDEK